MRWEASADSLQACSITSICPPPQCRRWQLPPVTFIVLAVFLVHPPSSLALPSIFFDLGSIDIQPLDEQGSILRICTEFHVSNISLGPGVAAAKLQFSPDGPSAVSYSSSDVLCADGVERGGRYRVQIMLVDDRDGSELPAQSPPGASSQPSVFVTVFTNVAAAAATDTHTSFQTCSRCSSAGTARLPSPLLHTALCFSRPRHISPSWCATAHTFPFLICSPRPTMVACTCSHPLLHLFSP